MSGNFWFGLNTLSVEGEYKPRQDFIHWGTAKLPRRELKLRIINGLACTREKRPLDFFDLDIDLSSSQHNGKKIKINKNLSRTQFDNYLIYRKISAIFQLTETVMEVILCARYASIWLKSLCLEKIDIPFFTLNRFDCNFTPRLRANAVFLSSATYRQENETLCMFITERVRSTFVRMQYKPRTGRT